jgi:Uma2 family endonuclease
VTNPIVIVAVLSQSTEAYDRGQKREHYQQIASLREYVLVAQDKREIEVYARPTGGIWQRCVHRAGQSVELPSLAIQFTVDELYNAAGVP